ncbi:MAG: 30S ribosomal protein S9 [Candidatus Omnitrophota bacterium]|nr:30S ribosomal protein S9 [Candidatus Omnitrophota bacterium]
MAENRFYATGRRKQAIARVWISQGQKGFNINGQGVMEYLQRSNLKELVERAMKAAQVEGQFGVRALVNGGGKAGQAGAVSLGIARALLKYNDTLRSILRRNGLLTRDPRSKERKKYGQKGARKRFQYTKR